MRSGPIFVVQPVSSALVGGLILSGLYCSRSYPRAHPLRGYPTPASPLAAKGPSATPTHCVGTRLQQAGASGRLRATVLLPASRGTAWERDPLLVHGLAGAPSSDHPRRGSHIGALRALGSGWGGLRWRGLLSGLTPYPSRPAGESHRGALARSRVEPCVLGGAASLRVGFPVSVASNRAFSTGPVVPTTV